MIIKNKYNSKIIWYTVHITFQELTEYYCEKSNLEGFCRLLELIYTNNLYVAENELLLKEYIIANEDLFNDNLSCISQIRINLVNNKKGYIEVSVCRQV